MPGNSILAKMAVQIVANNAKFNAAMKQSQAQMGDFQKVAKATTTALASFGLGFGIYEVLRGGLTVIKDFEKSMSEVRAITNATDKEFKALRDSALGLGRTTLFTAKQVSELQVAFGRLGFSNKEILNSTAATLQLATATGEDLAKSADIAGSTLRAFNLDAKEMQRVVDVMAASFNKSALGLDNFGESMKYVAPVSAAAGISLEETTAMLGVLADAGIRGSMAGTSLRRIISDVKEETGTLSERLAKLAEKGLTGADAMDEVGRHAYASLLILTKHVDKVNEGAEAYKNATGEAKKMADLMADNLAADFTKLSSAYDGLILQFSEGTGPLRDTVQGLTKLLAIISGGAAFYRSYGEYIGKVNDEGERMNKWIADMDEQAIRDAFGPIQKTMGFDGTRGFGGLFDRFSGAAPGDAMGLFQQDIKKDNPIKQATVDVKALVAEWDRLNQKTTEHPWSQVIDINDATKDFLPTFTDQLATLDTALQTNSNAWDVWLSGVQARAEIAGDAMDAHIEKTMRLAEVAQTVGGAIGDVFGTMATNQEELLQSMLRATEQIINMFLQQSIAAMIAAHIKDPKTAAFPFTKIAAAAAGIVAVKALFSSIGASAGGSGGRSSSGAPGRTLGDPAISGRSFVRGATIETVLGKNDYRRGRLG